KEKEGLALLALGQVLSGSLYDADRTEVMDAPHEPPAEGYFRRGLAVMRDLGNDAAIARGLEVFGRYKIENGETAQGTDLLREALAIYARLGLRRGEKVQAELQGT